MTRQRSWVPWITSWLAAIDFGWGWDDLLALLALGLLLLAVDAGSGAPSPLAVVAGWVWVDFVELYEILPDFRLWTFLTPKSTSSGQVDFFTVFGAQLWPFWAQTDLYPLLINLVVVVGCCRGSGRRVRHLLSQASG